ncbi:hypothetical protein LIER_02226 [Lithospermum erythrorhizon]|uniref:Myb/SANT-like DNA-binding domain-containing protein n=1 Tax=Lithospermum erythrorhizon TaxID=34254 RepID=A0AAV3NNR2_LITER
MEGNLSSASLMGASGSFGGFDLQRSIRINQQRQPNPVALHHQHLSHTNQISMVPAVHESFAPIIGSMQDSEQNIHPGEYMKSDREKYGSDEEEPSLMEDLGDGHNDLVKGKKASPWQRVKWTDTMVRLLITAVSYINEEAAAEYGGCGRRKYVNLQKKGKWKSVSKVMAEREHFVSPQQCEDKFNDLNKRYKRLNEILGRGTSCEVVENPTLLDVMDHISEKLKEEVRKILSSKHLHYEEMCSYHNQNRLHLPPDPELQRSLRLALRSRDDHDDNDVRRHLQDDNDDDEHDADLDNCDEDGENPVFHSDRRVSGIFSGGPLKKMKQHHGHDDTTAGGSLHTIDCNRIFDFQSHTAIADEQLSLEGTKANPMQKQLITHPSFQLEEQKLHIQTEMLHLQKQMLELERERFRWQRFSKKKDRELETMFMENERMKLENERMTLELKRKEMGFSGS